MIASLAALVARAVDGDTVAIPPGLSAGVGTVTITKSLQLVSDSGAEVSDDIVIRGPVAVRLSGITLGGVITACEGAHLAGRQCRFTARQHTPAVVAVGADTRVELSACRFTGGQANGVRLRGGATAQLMNCDFAFLESPAVAVEDPGSGVEVTSSRFATMTGHAVLVEAGGSARVADCDFDRFPAPRWNAVIAVGSAGRVEVTGCRFTASAAHGVYLRAGGFARVSDCRFEATGDLPALAADGPSTTAVLEGCRITTAEAAGVEASAGADIIVRDTQFDCPGVGGFAGGAIRLGHDGSSLRLGGRCGFRGATATVAAHLSAREAAEGAVVALDVVSRDYCSPCNGSGGRPGTALTACPLCTENAEERPSAEQRHARYGGPGCAGCAGSGFIPADPCTDCAGRGVCERIRRLEVDIPAGVRNGDTLIAPGMGVSGLRGGPAGDLRVIVSVRSVAEPPFRTVEEYFETAMGVRVADPGGAPPTAAPRRGRADDAARRDLDEAVRREAIRLGYLAADSIGDPSARSGAPRA